MKSVLPIHWKDWCWSFNTLATWCEKLTHWKRPWCWERLKAGGEGDNRGWNGWIASPTQWSWDWASSGVGDGQGSLACCSPWGCKESDMTEWLNWTKWNCRVRELEKVRFGKRTRLALYRNRSPLMRWEGATVRLVSCYTNSRKEYRHICENLLF